ncbi:MAG TPA: GNAT family N-acetyltransferase, partial [Phototrophicaceae bacterium]|nr:GNAT family N-acetyltransferase [Phototrophicaceae bacterium]
MSLFTVTPYERRHRQAVLDLLYSSYQSHIHLDWYTAEHWLDNVTMHMRLAWNSSRLVGVIGASEALFGTSWLRLVIIRDYQPTQVILNALWSSLSNELRQQSIRSVWILVANDWLTEYAPRLGFEQGEMVITLRRRSDDIPPPRLNSVIIRSAEAEDVDSMTSIDQLAFAPPWQLTRADLWQASRIAALCNTVWLDEKIVGYQLSTRHREAGHLARLAVLPELQGRGIGGTLVHHMIKAFASRGIRTLTVNTQLSNRQSQHLYQNYGFQRNGYDMPVWKIDL